MRFLLSVCYITIRIIEPGAQGFLRTAPGIWENRETVKNMGFADDKRKNTERRDGMKRKVWVEMVGMIAAAALCTGCQAEQADETRTPAETQMRTEETAQEQEEDAHAVSIIGGADGPASVFVAGKMTDAEEISDCPSFSGQAEELLIDPDKTGRVYLDSVHSYLQLTDENGEQLTDPEERTAAVIHGLWGTAVLARQEGESVWRAGSAADMKAVEDSYMKDEPSTEVFANNGTVFVYQMENGNIEKEYHIVMETGQLFARDVSEEDAGEELAFYEMLREIRDEEENRKPAAEADQEERLNRLKEEQEITNIWDRTVTADGTEVFLCSRGEKLKDLCLAWEDPESGTWKAETIVWNQES